MDYQPYLYSKRALLIINPVAGRKAVNTQIAPIIRIFMEAGYAKTVLWVAASSAARAAGSPSFLSLPFCVSLFAVSAFFCGG